MKELSIEEKAKAYDEAIERAKEINREHSKKGFKPSDDALYIFPELKESEDERIRKELIEFFTFEHWDGEAPFSADSARERIAWLEKQENLQEMLETAKQQGYKEGLRTGRAEVWEQIEKQNKQKPTVETKLKIKGGKWYVCIRDLLDNYANKAFYKGYIYLSTQNGSLIPSNSNVPFEVVCPDTYFKDWTIQDAKDGDVLAVGNIIFIYKRTLANHIVSYCKLINDAFESTADTRTCCEGNTYVHPTTKKQRDTFFAKMREYGYEWDAKKKKLRKVEQKSTQFTLEQANVLDKHIDKFLEQKPAWSEEDEKYLKLAIENFQTLGNSFLTTWFKSLKEIYTWKPSEEQMDALYTYIYNPQYFNSPDPRMELVESVYKDLKKLMEE